VTTITEPGVYYDLDERTYHAQHDWLSWSMAKHLLPPSTPAHFKARIGVREERKRTFDLGKVVHALVLGKGAEFEVVQSLGQDKEPRDATSYDLVSAQKHRDEIYDAGRVPILRTELEQAEAMAASVREHRTANLLLSNGKPEVSLFWVAPETGVKCRARLDWLPDPTPGRRLIVPDVKTARDAHDREFANAAARYRYFGQQRWYLDGIKALGLDPDPAFVFVVLEKEPPHLINVGQFANKVDDDLARIAVDHCRRLFKSCADADFWPGYGDGINEFNLPNWVHYELEELYG